MEKDGDEENGGNVTPREIQGLNQLLNRESFGGNSASHRGSVNAYYKDGEFNLWTGTHPKEADSYPQVAYRAVTVSPRAMYAMIDAGKPIPPPLIDLVIPSNADAETAEMFNKRALEHNVQMALDFIAEGGNPDNLPPTPLLPDLEDFF